MLHKGKYIGKEVRSLSNVIMRYIESRYLPRGLDRITVNNSWILEYLMENRGRDIFARDIEDEFSVTRSTVSKVIEIMEGKDLIQRESVNYDARLKKLVLTQKAYKFYDQIQHKQSEFEMIILKDFSDKECEMLLSFLQRMKSNILKYGFCEEGRLVDDKKIGKKH